MKLFIFILLSFCFLNSHLVYAFKCFKPNPVKKDQKQVSKEVSVASNKQIQKPIPKHVLEQAQKSVWRIGNFSPKGTGFFISPNEFVTNFHVVINTLKEDDGFLALNQGDHRSLSIKKVKHLSPLSDLAVLETELEVSNYLNLAEKNPELKENLSLVGYPNGEFKIIDKAYDISYESELEYIYATKHTKYSGASGSPVLNSKGEVVGVHHSSSRGNYVGVVKIIHLKNLLKQDSPSFKNPKDHLEHSIKELKKMAKKRKNIIAQYSLGEIYLDGKGVEKDPKEAARWFRKSAKRGYAKAQEYFGLMHENGWGVKKDLKEAARWYEKAAEQGLASAQFRLGVMHEKGQGVEKDPKEVARWYEKAAEQGYVIAQYNLGYMYATGQGVKENFEEATRWFREAAEQGYMKAQFNLGIMYATGWGVKKDLKEAARWYEKAAEQGDAEAKFELGVLYAKNSDFEKAFVWLRKASEQGHTTRSIMKEKYPELLKLVEDAARSRLKEEDPELFKSIEDSGARLKAVDPELFKLIERRTSRAFQIN